MEIRSKQCLRDKGDQLDNILKEPTMNPRMPYKVWVICCLWTNFQSLGVLSCCERPFKLMEVDEKGQGGTDYLVLIKLLLKSLFAFMIE